MARTITAARTSRETAVSRETVARARIEADAKANHTAAVARAKAERDAFLSLVGAQRPGVARTQLEDMADLDAALEL